MERALLLFFVAFSGAMATLVAIAFADSLVAKDVLEALRSVATIGVAGVGVIIAWRGLQTWSRQVRGTARFEACRRFLEATFRFRDEVAGARSPLQQVLLKEGEDHGAAIDRDTLERLQRLWTLVRECEVAAYAVEVTVGSQAKEWALSLRRVVIELDLAIRSIVHRPTSYLDEHEARDILYESKNERSAEFTNLIASRIATIESALGPILRESA